jgi:hypothetical protein
MTDKGFQEALFATTIEHIGTIGSQEVAASIVKALCIVLCDLSRDKEIAKACTSAAIDAAWPQTETFMERLTKEVEWRKAAD